MRSFLSPQNAPPHRCGCILSSYGCRESVDCLRGRLNRRRSQSHVSVSLWFGITCLAMLVDTARPPGELSATPEEMDHARLELEILENYVAPPRTGDSGGELDFFEDGDDDDDDGYGGSYTPEGGSQPVAFHLGRVGIHVAEHVLELRLPRPPAAADAAEYHAYGAGIDVDSRASSSDANDAAAATGAGKHEDYPPTAECPFAWIDDHPRWYAGEDMVANSRREQADHWQEVLAAGDAALGTQDSRPSSRAVFDALNAFASVIRCCPGSMLGLPPSGDGNIIFKKYHHDDQDTFSSLSTARVGRGGSDGSSSGSGGGGGSGGRYATDETAKTTLPSCGLLYFEGNNEIDMEDDDDGADPSDGGRSMILGKSRYFGIDLILRFSRALRLARRPVVAALVLQDGRDLEMDRHRRTLWGRGMAMALLQEGDVAHAISYLEDAIGYDKRDLRTLQLLASALVVRGHVNKGFSYLRHAVDLQQSIVHWTFAMLLEDEDIDTSMLEDTPTPQEVLVTRRDWMVMFFGWALEGKWRELGGSVPVLRRVENFLESHFSMDSETCFMLGRDLAKRGFEVEGWHYLSSAAAPWNRQIYRVRAALSIPAVSRSRQDLEASMGALEKGISSFLPPRKRKVPNRTPDSIQSFASPYSCEAHEVMSEAAQCGGNDGGSHAEFERSGGGEFRCTGCAGYFDEDRESREASNGSEHVRGGGTTPSTTAASVKSGNTGPLFTCSFGELNYPDVAFDDLPLLPFADYYRPNLPAILEPSSALPGGVSAVDTETFPFEFFSDSDPGVRPGGSVGNREDVGSYADEVWGHGYDDDVVETSLHANLASLFLGMCPELGDFVAPRLEAYPGAEGGSWGVGGGAGARNERKVKVAFVSSRFGNDGATKRVAALMKLLPREYFEVIVASWPTPVDAWTREHVLPIAGKRSINLVQNRTISLERLAKRRPDVVVFADASADRKAYLLAFGRIAPVQVAMWGHAPTLGIPSVDYYVVPESLAADAWQGNGNLDSNAQCPVQFDSHDEAGDLLMGCTNGGGDRCDDGQREDRVENDRNSVHEEGRAEWSGGGVAGTAGRSGLSGGGDGVCGDRRERNGEEQSRKHSEELGNSPVVNAVRNLQESADLLRLGGENGLGFITGDVPEIFRERLADYRELLAEYRERLADYRERLGDMDEITSGRRGRPASRKIRKGASNRSLDRPGHGGEEDLTVSRGKQGEGLDDYLDGENGAQEIQPRRDDRPAPASCLIVVGGECYMGDGDSQLKQFPTSLVWQSGGKVVTISGRGSQAGAGDEEAGHASQLKILSKLAEYREERHPEHSRLSEQLLFEQTAAATVQGEGEGARGAGGGDLPRAHRSASSSRRPGGGGSGPGIEDPDLFEDSNNGIGDDYVEIAADVEGDIDPETDDILFERHPEFSRQAGSATATGVRPRSGDRRQPTQPGVEAVAGGEFRGGTMADKQHDHKSNTWTEPWANADYGATVEEQVVLLSGFGPFVEPPGRTGGNGRAKGGAETGEMEGKARGKVRGGSSATEIRRRYLMPANCSLAVLPIPVYHFHPDFDMAVAMLLDRDPRIHVVVAVEETAGEAVGTERGFYQYDALQYGAAPRWTEKLRKRLAWRLGAKIRRLHLFPPLDSRDYFSLLGGADVILDPFPVGNLHPAVDALALGTPVVTLPIRQRAGARYVQALLSENGVPPECCAATDVHNYVDLAARLCMDEGWATKISAILERVKHSVYLRPEYSRQQPSSPSSSKHPSGKPSGQYTDRQQPNTRVDKKDRSQTTEGKHRPGHTSCCDSRGEGQAAERAKREESPWGREHEHVAEWAEFLWRVARPGVKPRSVIEDKEQASTGSMMNQLEQGVAAETVET